MRQPRRPKTPPPAKRFGNVIRLWREHRGLTLEELAERSGLTPTSISNIERGVHGYSRDSLEKLADALGVQPGDLLSRPPAQDTTINDLWTKLDIEDRARAIDLIRLMTRRD